MRGPAVQPRSELGLGTGVRNRIKLKREEWNGLHLKFLDDESNEYLEGPVPRRQALLAD
jgi:hypothetical protein